jgi:NTP pyrophosphatase (non-canonical NTP hydrolase)
MKTVDNIPATPAHEVNQVIKAIGLPAVLEQCAEELAELTQATLKMARKLRGENPTPVTHSQAAEHLHEELGDVRLCLKVLDAAMGGDNTAAVEAEKLRRWLDRITQEQKNPE